MSGTVNTNRDSAAKQLDLLNAALHLRQAGRREQALELAEQAIQMAPDYAPAHVTRGLLLQELEKSAEAEAAFRKALSLDPLDEKASKSLGLMLVGKERFAESLPYLRAYVQRYPADIDTMNALVVALTRLEQPDEITAVQRAAWEKTRNPELGIRYARFLFSRNDASTARTILERIVEQEPTARSLTELSLAQVILKEYPQAIVSLLKAIEIEPKFDRAWRGLAFCYTKTGQLDEAIQAAEEAIKLNDHHYRNWQAMGDAMLALRRFDQALVTAQKGIDLIDLQKDPEAAPVLAVLYLQKFNAHLGLGDNQAALNELAGARRAMPFEQRFYTYPAQLLLGLGQPDVAMRIFNDAQQSGLPNEFIVSTTLNFLLNANELERAWDYLCAQNDQIQAKFIEVMNSLGYDAYVKGQCDFARQIFDHLVQKYPSNPLYATNLAFILIGSGDHERAEELLQNVLHNQQEQGIEQHPLANCNLGYLYLAQGKFAEAQACLESAFAAATDEDVNIVRVAFWLGQQIVPGCATYPTQSIPLRAAARANLAAIHLARGEHAAAQQQASALLEEYPEMSLGPQVMGSVALALGDKSAAAQAWQQALALAQDGAEKEMLAAWLEGIG